MKLNCIFFLFSFSLFAGTLSPFKTDLCTGFLEGPPGKPNQWAHCCILHDIAYWASGTKADSDRADKRLKHCVTKASGSFWGNLLYTGVRAGRYSPIKFVNILNRTCVIRRDHTGNQYRGIELI